MKSVLISIRPEWVEKITSGGGYSTAKNNRILQAGDPQVMAHILQSANFKLRF